MYAKSRETSIHERSFSPETKIIGSYVMHMSSLKHISKRYLATFPKLHSTAAFENYEF